MTETNKQTPKIGNTIGNSAGRRVLGAKESDLNKLSEDDLKAVLLEMGLETPKTKKEMIELIAKHTKNTRSRDHDSDGDGEIETDLNKSIEEGKMEDKEEEEKNTNETSEKITDNKKSEELNEIEDAEEDITNKVEEESPAEVQSSPQQGQEEEKEKEEEKIQNTESPDKMEIVDDDIYASISADNLNDKFNEQDDEENKENDKSNENEDNTDESEKTKMKSCIIHVSGFVRPFSTQDAEELFSRCGGGSYNYYWMNRVKSNAYISYKTVADATRALKELDGMILQNGSKSKLTAKFGDENIAIRAIQNDAKINRSPLAIKLLKEFKEKGLLLAPEQTSKKEEEDTNKKVSTKRIIKESISNEDEDDKDIDTQPQKKKKKANTRLDELFMKTECEPHIYYLPLTDQELEERDKIRREKRKERK